MATVKILLIGGGGSGGNSDRGGGGGGAGGYIANNSYSLSAGSYPIVIGNGGAHVSNGEDSTFNGLTAIGGGHGGFNPAVGNGGSGGGGGHHSNEAGGLGTVGQGNDGGIGHDAFNTFPGGGGGGSGGVGSAGVEGKAGDGGAGTSNSITGSPVSYAGGGGGGLQGGTVGNGQAGGGNGGNNANGSSATANTGSGGGGMGTAPNTAGQGGSGVFIISYPTASFGNSSGGTKSTDGSNTVHTFTSSGTLILVPLTNTFTFTVDALVILRGLPTFTIDGRIVFNFSIDGIIKALATPSTFTIDGDIVDTGFYLNNMKLKNPKTFSREFIYQKTDYTSMNGKTSRDTSSRKLKYMLGFEKLTKGEVDVFMDLVSVNIPVSLLVRGLAFADILTDVFPYIASITYDIVGSDYLAHLELELIEEE